LEKIGAGEVEDSLYWVIRLTERGEAVGYVGLHRISTESPALSYAILPQYRREGIASDALQSILAHIHRAMGIHSVYARTGERNVASAALLTKLGFSGPVRVTASHGPRLEFVHKQN